MKIQTIESEKTERNRHTDHPIHRDWKKDIATVIGWGHTNSDRQTINIKKIL